MRHYSRALNAELSKYRKRKRISLDGTIAGQTAGMYIGGLHHVRLPGSRSRGALAGQPQSIYDAKAFYDWPDREYEQYEPFGMSHVSRPSFQPHHMPHNTGQGQEMPGRISVPDDDLTLIEQLRIAQGEIPLQRENLEAPFLNGTTPAPDNPAPDNIGSNPDDSSVDTFPSLPEVADALEQLSRVLPPDHQDLINLRMAAQEWLDLLNAWSQGANIPHSGSHYETAAPTAGPDYGGPMTQDMFDQTMTQAEPQMMHEPMAEALDPMQDAYEQQFEQGLEAIVQEAMPEQDPFEMQQRMYDEQMQMMMNPFMMPGQFGPGPIGP